MYECVWERAGVVDYISSANVMDNTIHRTWPTTCRS